MNLSRFEKFLDGFVFLTHHNLLSVTILIIRNGKLIGTKTEILEEDLSKETVETYILQYYTNIRQFPEEIFISTKEVDIDENLIISALEIISKTKINLRKKRIKGLVEHAENNAKIQTDIYLQKTENYFQALERLKYIYSVENVPNTIECVDISHLSGSFTVGVSIRWNQNNFDKKNYKKYKMRNDFNDDFESIYELFIRKLRRIKKGDEQIADIYVIDGGIGQLNAAKKAFDEMKMESNLMSISKGRSIKNQKFKNDISIESIHIFGRSNPLNLKRYDKLLLFIQKLRDEAHRFVIEYSRKLALRNLTTSPFLKIDGLGEKRLKRLLKEFPDIHSNNDIEAKDIYKRCKIPLKIAEKIIEYKKNN
jgi:excinuclease ABC subunit C